MSSQAMIMLLNGESDEELNFFQTHQSRKEECVREGLFSFMKLPRELRDEIYDYSLDYGGVQRCIRIQWVSKELLPVQNLIKMKSPGILRINKEVSAEAMEALNRKHVVIWKPPRIDKNAGLGDKVVMQFVGQMTLSRLQRCTFQLPDEPPSNRMRDYGFNNRSSGGEQYVACFWVELMRTCFREWSYQDNLKELCVQYGQEKNALKESGNKFVIIASEMLDKHYDDFRFNHKYAKIPQKLRSMMQNEGHVLEVTDSEPEDGEDESEDSEDDMEDSEDEVDDGKDDVEDEAEEVENDEDRSEETE